ncbi:MAG TPA: DUF6055 domain-containing protein [Anaerohalosphaeraceae bacterium]|nr:DUF6055 domain-containing protein [Anaerohalosphaeraceae bacterium]HOL31661.1 DUF6055 domain-containing protein [Anaerohalosphaeraceae bacterium]HOM75390.1 DUF6055 domain-containing protein [Anaerohalosphaeraceae bacterium]HPC64878.1 DUF6055 domain-containing protein [Anaerohalosphaeraceae bacterium]HRS71171.1 DUF6055 domain-containing protein [Anaerohalosphaeraceae bacterium]
MYSKNTRHPVAAVIAAIVFFSLQAAAQESEKTVSSPKELYLPKKADRVPENNDYNSQDSEYCFKRMVQSDNIAIFWSKEYGDDPLGNPDARKRFDVQFMLSECERFYKYYIDELKLVQKGNSISDKYKMLVYVFGGEGGTAFGGGVDEKIGVLWTPAVRVNKPPYGVLAHEMVHSFQYIIGIDTGKHLRGSIVEMSAQLMLWQVYPEWMTFENYHLVDFMKKTHYAFLHPTNMYHSPYVLEYWLNKHGKEFFGRLYRETLPNEDPVTTYKRILSVTQDEFNNEMFDASRRFITWDMKRIEKVARPYANQHQCSLIPAEDGWYRIAPSRCPQNYGYNGIRLKVPSPGTEVVLHFNGIAGAEGYNAVKIEMAGWRYGFLASLKDGGRIYSSVGKEPQGILAFTVPENTEYLWLVVMGAPVEHWPVAGGRGRRADNTAEEQWPYQIHLKGTAPDDSVIQ